MAAFGYTCALHAPVTSKAWLHHASSVAEVRAGRATQLIVALGPSLHLHQPHSA